MYGKMKVQGIRVTYMVSAVLAIVFFVKFVGGVVLMSAIHIPSIMRGMSMESVGSSNLGWLIGVYLMQMMTPFLPLIGAIIIRNGSKKYIEEQLEHNTVFFAAGVYLILSNISLIGSLLTTIITLGMNSRVGWGAHLNWAMIARSFSLSLVPVGYIVFGFIFLCKSGLLVKKQEKVEVID